MNGVRQVVGILMHGILAALLSTAIILGSLSLAMTENSRRVALAPTFTAGPTLPPGVPSPTAAPPASPSPTPSCPIPSGWVVITIQPGDTLQSLAEAYGTTPNELASGNCLPSANVTLHPGNQLAVPGLPSTTASEPAPTLTPTPTLTETSFPTDTPVPCGHPAGWILYVIQRGDTLTHIATLFQTTVNDLMIANCMGSVDIFYGQKLWVPNNPTLTPVVSKTPTPTRTPAPSQTPTLPPAGTETPAPLPSETPTATDTEIPSPPTATDTDTPLPPSETPTPAGTLVTAPSKTPTPMATAAPSG